MAERTGRQPAYAFAQMSAEMPRQPDAWLPRLPQPGDAAGLVDEVHLWRFQVDDVKAAAELEANLSPDERRRAHRYRAEKPRRRFVVGRGRLRQVLGGYLGCPPSEVAFRYGNKGKPAADGAHADWLSFNLSHSGELGLLAVSRHRPLGVDLERHRDMPQMLQLARRFFAPAEADALAALPEAHRRDAFFCCWTRKEAFIKAMGDGLLHALDRFEVTMRPGEPACLLCVDGDRGQAAQWRMCDVPAEPGYAAALVAEAGHWQPRWFQLDVGSYGDAIRA